MEKFQIDRFKIEHWGRFSTFDTDSEGKVAKVDYLDLKVSPSHGRSTSTPDPAQGA